ncbi:MAG: hypothetical protein JNJ77_08575 [Planctomycetia bacterium]|nr:hypothetical protein [Planctomycetia bacterium]
MNAKQKSSLVIPLLVMAVGIGWLLSALSYVPDVNWLWTIGLAAAGILTLVMAGIDKFSVVIGPFFLLASVLSVFRQTGWLTLNIEIPLLVIGVGALMVLAQSPRIPMPDRLTAPIPENEEERVASPKKYKL